MEKNRNITIAKAVREALHEEMQADESVIVIGYELESGGTFKCTEGLLKRYGTDRVVDAPISECGEVGLAIGTALFGKRPVMEMMLADFSYVAFDPITMYLPKLMWMGAGQIEKMPVVIRMPSGQGGSFGPHHSQTCYTAYTNFPGLKIVFPSNAYDAKGMLKAAIRDDNPILFFEPANLYMNRMEVPEEDYTVPIGKAAVVREGKDLTVVTVGYGVGKALKAAEKLAEAGINVEVIDLRTIKPLDIETICKSVSKTGRLLIEDEGHESFGITGEIAFKVNQQCYKELKQPVERVCMPDVSIPVGPSLEPAVYVQPEWIINKAKEMME